IHNRLQLPQTLNDPFSFLLNRLSTQKPSSKQKACVWPTICAILQEMYYLAHSSLP
ncbi:hypothetical protein BCV72DRAFT_192637, partial [Rhizopus microsporus var. microsporus]